MTGENGVLTKASKAKNVTREKQEEENATIDKYEEEIGKYLEDEIPKEELDKITNVDTEKTDPVKAMPKGTKKVIEGDATKGIVIKDSKDNEWAWVVVPKTEVFKTATESNQYKTIETDLINYVTSPTNYRESGYEDKWFVRKSTYGSYIKVNVLEVPPSDLTEELKNTVTTNNR